MAKQTINIGASPNDGTGTPLRTSFDYTNQNFTELYTATGPSGNNIVVPGTATITGDLTVDTNVLKVDSTNNRVGIGTASPAAALDVFGGNIRLVGGNIFQILNSVNDSNVDISNNGGTGVASMLFKVAGSSAMTLNSTGLGLGGTPSGVNRFSVFNGATQALTLDTSGNLLVGRTTLFAQASRLTIESNSQTTSICGVFNDSRTDAASAINIAFYRNGTKVGSVDCTNAATSYVTSSDYRLKDDVQPLSGGLSRVCALKPSIYKWKINGFNGEGFIAHELAEVVPFAVTGEKDAVNKDGTVNPQGVDLSKVVPILVAAIQELTARVQTLEAK